jgi:hypothetical protein
MKEIQLTQGKVAIVDDEDYEKVNQFKWYAGKIDNTFYAMTSVLINGKHKTLYMHQFIMGDNLLKLHIDHKDGDGLHNWKLNLRSCTNRENRRNAKKRKSSSSIYKGVSLNKSLGKWIASIHAEDGSIHLGVFEIERDAALAYDISAVKYHGEFAGLNFPEISLEEKLGILSKSIIFTQNKKEQEKMNKHNTPMDFKTVTQISENSITCDGHVWLTRKAYSASLGLSPQSLGSPYAHVRAGRAAQFNFFSTSFFRVI